MIEFELDVEDLAGTRFAIAPLHETVFSLWALRDPGRYPAHLPWLRTVPGRLGALDRRLLFSLVGPDRAVPDFLTPRPAGFAPAVEDQLAEVRRTPPDVVRRDLLGAYAPWSLPPVLARPVAEGDAGIRRLRDELGDLLAHYWELAVRPIWPRARSMLETDVTHRASRLARGGARLLFDDLHPNLGWENGTLRIEKMIGRHRVPVGGRGMVLLPSLFAYKPVPPVHPAVPPELSFPGRGAATVWGPPPKAGTGALTALVGAPKAELLHLLDEPLPTIELARRLRVTPSAVSQHLGVLRATGLVTRTRNGRHVLYGRSPLADRLSGRPPSPDGGQNG